MKTDEATHDEAWITDLLRARAQRITVQSDLAAVTNRPRLSPGKAPAWPWWAAAAAVLVVVVGALVTTLDSTDKSVDTSPASGLSGDLREFAAPAGAGEQLLVWMEPDATSQQIQTVSIRLASSAEVDDYVYVDREASYQEFLDHFADKPEVIDLVQPEQLPTFFRVTTGTPTEVARLVDILAGVAESTTGPIEGD